MFLVRFVHAIWFLLLLNLSRELPGVVGDLISVSTVSSTSPSIFWWLLRLHRLGIAAPLGELMLMAHGRGVRRSVLLEVRDHCWRDLVVLR